MKYRYLEEGEIVEAGDEINIFADSWMPVNQSIGQKAPPNAQSQKDLSIYPKYRRAITMKYDILKPVSVESVTEVCQVAAEKLAFWLLVRHPSGVGYCRNRDDSEIEAMPDNFRTWLVENDFIREVPKFEPFDIRVETAEECRDLAHIVGTSGKAYTIWIQIEPYYRKLEADK